jgi:hypothetical protein
MGARAVGSMTDEFASDLAALLVAHHREQLESDDEAIRAAVVVKTVALVSLAFGVPPTNFAPLDVDDELAKLKTALRVLEVAQ